MSDTALAEKKEEQKKELVVKGPVETIRDLLEKSKSQIALALPKHLDPDRLLRMAMTTIRRNPKLLKCDARSLLGSVIQCAQLGLEPDDILGRAYLVPFEDHKKGTSEAQLIVGYKGLIELAYRSGKVKDIYAVIVYEKEFFKLIAGTDYRIEHTPLPPSERGEKIIGVYAIAHLTNGGTPSAWMWKEEVDEIKAKSKGIKSPYSPWKLYEGEMTKKTGIRRLSKQVPLSPEYQKAAALDELGDAGKSQKEVFFGDEEVLDVTAQEVAEKTDGKTDELKKQLADSKAKAGEGAPAAKSPSEIIAEAQALTKELNISHPSVLLAARTGGTVSLDELGPDELQGYLDFLKAMQNGEFTAQWDDITSKYNITEMVA